MLRRNFNVLKLPRWQSCSNVSDSNNNDNALNVLHPKNERTYVIFSKPRSFTFFETRYTLLIPSLYYINLLECTGAALQYGIDIAIFLSKCISLSGWLNRARNIARIVGTAFVSVYSKFHVRKFENPQRRFDRSRQVNQWNKYLFSLPFFQLPSRVYESAWITYKRTSHLEQRWLTGGPCPPLFWPLALSPPLHRSHPLRWECCGDNTRVKWFIYVYIYIAAEVNTRRAQDPHIFGATGETLYNAYMHLFNSHW